MNDTFHTNNPIKEKWTIFMIEPSSHNMLSVYIYMEIVFLTNKETLTKACLLTSLFPLCVINRSDCTGVYL